MSDTDNNNKVDIDKVSADICANCGKGEENKTSLKACTACNMVKYCNRECQIAHWPQHKKACKKRTAELHDEKLFKQPPTEYGDCPICFLPMPSIHTGRIYMECCGKQICSGCVYAPVYDDQGKVIAEEVCPFCRTPLPNSEDENNKRMNKRVDVGDIEAFCIKGYYYANGSNGFPRDMDKALELWYKAGERGHAASYCNIGTSYDKGVGVTVDKKKAIRYYELSAMSGDVKARHNLGVIEVEAGNMNRALKHYMIAVKDGDDDSLKQIQLLYSNGHVTKDDYTIALQLYQEYLGEIKSEQRDNAASTRGAKYIN